MPNIKKKTAKSIIYIFFAVIIAIIVSLEVGLYNELEESQSDGFDYMKNFIETYESYLTKEKNEEALVRSDMEDMARMTALAIERSGSKILPGEYAHGVIVKVGRDGIESPVTLPDEITPAVFSGNDVGTFDTDTQTMAYSRIKDDLYYVEFSEAFNVADVVSDDEKADALQALEDMAAARKCDYLYMAEDEDGTDDYKIFCGTGNFNQYTHLSELDISKQDMDKVYDSLRTGSHHKIHIGSRQYDVCFKKTGDGRAAAILIPVNATMLSSIEQTSIFVSAFLILCIVITCWLLFIYDAVKNHMISPQDYNRYKPRSVRINVGIAVVFSFVFVFIVCLYTQSLENVFKQTSNGQAILQYLTYRVDEEKKISDSLWQDAQDRYTAKAERVAFLFDKNRELQNKDWLREASKIIGADYIMIFDKDGNELISDSAYRGLSLGTTEDSPTYDFRRLLNGVKSISHAGVKDDITGLTLDMHGLAIRYHSDDDAYGALILAVDPDKSGKRHFADVNEIAESMLTDKAICFAVDPKTGLIKYSTDPSILSLKAEDVGLDKEDLRNSYMGVLSIGDKEYYLTSGQDESLLYFCGKRREGMIAGNLRYALIVALLTLVLLSGLAFVLLKGYKEDAYAAAVWTQESSAQTSISALHPTKDDLMKDHLYSFAFLNPEASPDVRTGSVLLLCVVAVLIPLLIRIHTGGNTLGGEGSVVSYIGTGNWDRGINIFAVSAALSLLCHATVVLIILRFIINVAGTFIGAKGHTVTTLFYNIMFCFIVIGCILMALEYFGVDTRALFASFGLAGLAISLGAKDFISDIIAGITLMMDGSYKIGDIIQIGDFKGKVLSINMRKTMAMDWQGSVRTFSNSIITDVTNHSLYPYIYELEFTLPLGCTIETAEEIIANEFPKLKERCPLIIEGPEYRGVSVAGFERGYFFTKISIYAACNYGDRFEVNNFLSREMRLMFENLESSNMALGPLFTQLSNDAIIEKK